MKTQCKECGMAFPVEPEFIGYEVDCPHCGAKRILQSSEIIRNRPRHTEESKGGFDGLGFALGLCFNALGIFIAAAIGGRRGGISALWGFLANDIIIVLGMALRSALSGY